MAQQTQAKPSTQRDTQTLTKLTVDEAKVLRKSFDGPALALPRLQEINPSVAQVLVCEKAIPKTFQRRVDYTVLVDGTDAAGRKAKVPETRSRDYTITVLGFSLAIDGLESISEESARVLASHQGDLSLNGIRDLDPAAATALSQHRYQLSLDGIESLDLKTAACLSRHSGPLSLRGLRNPTKELKDTLAPADVVLE